MNCNEDPDGGADLRGLLGASESMCTAALQNEILQYQVVTALAASYVGQ